MRSLAILTSSPCPVGWISVIRVLGDIFGIPGFYTWHLVMAVLMCVVWFVLFALTGYAFWKGIIFLADDEEVRKDTMVTCEEAGRWKRDDA